MAVRYGGGVGSTAVASLAWGPDFGDDPGSDGNSFGVGLLADLEALDLAGDIAVAAAADLDALDVDGGVGVVGTVHGTALGAPFWQSVATAAGETTSLVIGKPAGTAAGDLLVAHIGVGGAMTDSRTITPPSGWTTLHSATSTGAAKMHGYTAWRAAGASEPANYAFGSDAIFLMTGEIHRFVGADPTTPINVSAVATLNATALDTDPNSPAVVTTVANCMVIRFLAHDHLTLSQTHGPDANQVERSDFEPSGGPGFIGAHSTTRAYAAVGNTGGTNHDCSETVATDAVMTTIAIAPGEVTLA